MDYPKISLITVSLNSASTIKRTIDSVINQNYSNVEYIVIDGASTDGTRKIVEKSKKDTGFPHIFVSEPDNGIYNAMNKGIKRASGELVCILNSDDWLEDNALISVAEEYLKRDDPPKYCVYYGMERRVRDGKEETVGFHSHNFLKEASLPHQACYITKTCYDELTLYDEKLKSASDYKLLLELMLSNKVEFVPIYKILSNFTVGGMSSKAIGYREEAEIRHQLGLITNKYYMYLIIRVFLLKIFGQLK